MLKPTGKPGAPRYIYPSATDLRFTMLLTWRLLRGAKSRLLRWTGNCGLLPWMREFSCWVREAGTLPLLEKNARSGARRTSPPLIVRHHCATMLTVATRLVPYVTVTG